MAASSFLKQPNIWKWRSCAWSPHVANGDKVGQRWFKNRDRKIKDLRPHLFVITTDNANPKRARRELSLF